MTEERKSLTCKGVYKAFGKNEVLRGVDLTIDPGKIYGLIGRNGIGKTTLLGIMTGQNTCDRGSVTYGGEPVWENEKVIGEICFSRELSPTLLFGQNNLRVKEYFKMAECYYPRWDQEYAMRLVKEFGLDLKKKVCKMNKGMMSMVTIVLALASCAPITILDEPVAGLDVYMRDRFYSLLLEDYARTERTFVISTHIIEEAANLLEETIILNDGVIALKENTQDLIDSCRYIGGLDEKVDEAVRGFTVLHEEALGRSKTVCVRLNADQAAELDGYGDELTVSPVPLQKIFVYLTKQKGEVV